jgi:DNA-binding IclR family transcriptional regulator
MTAPESWFATRTMGAIELVAFGPRSAPEVADGLQVHPRTARRLLNRLVADGYLTRSEGERRIYAPTMRLVALAGQIVEHCELTQVAVPHVERLHARTGAAAHLEVPSYRSVLCLVHKAGDATARPQLRELVPCHCTAAGKTLLAYRERWRESVLGRPLERHTDRTLVDPAGLMREAAKIRERGFAIEDREYQPGVRSIAAPVYDGTGEAVAALAISGSVEVLDAERLLMRAMVVRDSAARLSEALGYRGACIEHDTAASHG